MNNKSCIVCGKNCEILPVQLGDLFTICYLRVCSHECMFLIAYEFICDRNKHKEFRGMLYDMQNEEDKKLRDNYVKEVNQELNEDLFNFIDNTKFESIEETGFNKDSHFP